MSKITFVEPAGAEIVVETTEGTSIMRAAVSNSVPGIIGECGGQAMCATCHVYVHEEYIAALSPMSDDEEEMLEEAAAPVDAERSRLGCQLLAGRDFADIVVDVPQEQV